MTPPKLLLFESFGGHWRAYEDALHRIFMDEIVQGALQFRNQRVSCRRNPETAGRWSSFWHLVQEGRVEEEREPDLRRCERLGWVRWVIGAPSRGAARAEFGNCRPVPCARGQHPPAPGEGLSVLTGKWLVLSPICVVRHFTMFRVGRVVWACPFDSDGGHPEPVRCRKISARIRTNRTLQRACARHAPSTRSTYMARLLVPVVRASSAPSGAYRYLLSNAG